MKLISCRVQNFASYKDLSFDFSGQGLALIHGPTGSGKSTLCDVAPWVLFGKTAKGGAVDDILSWPGDQIAKGEITVETNSGPITVIRTRGPKPKDNDLYFDDKVRGKDVTDTQKLINQRLGIDCELYLAGAYVHEFSATASFFITTPKARRTICEQIVDLSLAKKIQTDSSDKKKDLKRSLDKTRLELESTEHRIAQSQSLIERLQVKEKAFTQDKDRAVARILDQAIAFDKQNTDSYVELKEQNEILTEAIAALRDLAVCPTCGNEDHRKNDLNNQLNRNLSTMRQLKAAKNPYKQQLESEKARENTYLEQIQDLGSQIDLALGKHSSLQTNETEQATALSDLEALGEIITNFRAHLVSSTIKRLEETTNKLLNIHFDSEIQVSFDATDDVDVNITKDGNSCVYSQLSKGQRQLLKLCFAVSVMQQVSNHKGIRFSQIFLDEAFDGLGEQMKTKAFGLLQALELDYDSVFVVDHSETLKALFNKRYQVELLNGVSAINEET